MTLLLASWLALAAVACADDSDTPLSRGPMEAEARAYPGQELFELLQDSQVRSWARAVALVTDRVRCPADSLQDCELRYATAYGHREELCTAEEIEQAGDELLAPEEPWALADERLYHQPLGGSATAFLVGPDLVLTAGHAVHGGHQAWCDETSFVFDFAYHRSYDDDPTAIARESVFRCRRVLAAEHHDEQQGCIETPVRDYALVQLDRPAAGRPPLSLQRHAPPAAGTELVVLGHPAGMPLKVVPGHVLESSSSWPYFISSAFTFRGNSGSPVLDAATGLVQGIHVHGGVERYVALLVDPAAEEAGFCHAWNMSCDHVTEISCDCRGNHDVRPALFTEQIPGCEGRCGERYTSPDGTLACGCDAGCHERGDCCWDLDQHC